MIAEYYPPRRILDENPEYLERPERSESPRIRGYIWTKEECRDTQKGGEMGAQRLEDYLWHILDENIALARVGEDEDVGLKAAQTFEEAGVRSPYHGLVVRMRDGSEYQLPIVPSSLSGAKWGPTR